MDPTFFDSQDEFRAWLVENHAREKELPVGFYKKGSGRGGITYPQALDEALCAGWIDGVRKSVDEERYTIRFTPRRRGSYWSEVNVRRMGELLAEAGRVLPAGRAAFEARDPEKTKLYSFEERTRPLDEALEQRFRGDGPAWAFWETQPPGYRKTASWWVMSAKKQETRDRRLAKLMEWSAAGRRLTEVSGEKT